MDNRWAGLVILLLWNPHVLECGQRSQNGATDPNRVLALWWCNDLDFHWVGRQVGDFFVHTVRNAWIHGGTAWQHYIRVQIFSDIDIALHNRVESGLVNTRNFKAQKRGLKQGLWTSETFITWNLKSYVNSDKNT